MMKNFIILSVFLLVSSSQLFGKTVTTEGIAYIGNGITVEDAKKIALNDARQKALNMLGGFFESHKTVINNTLSKDEISSITGAVMKSTVLKSEKAVTEETFVLKLVVKFDIDMDSFERALDKYQADSNAKATIEKLMSIIKKQQETLEKTKKGSFETAELAEEIEYFNNRLSKALTTREKVNRELEIKIQYEKQLTLLLRDYAALFVKELQELYEINDIPNNKGYFIWRTNKARNAKFKEVLFDKLQDINRVVIKYNLEDLKTYPKICFKLGVEYSIFYYINENRNKIQLGQIKNGKSKPIVYSLAPVILSLSQLDMSGRSSYGYRAPDNGGVVMLSGEESSHLLRRWFGIQKYVEEGHFAFTEGVVKWQSLDGTEIYDFYRASKDIKIYLPLGVDSKDVSTVDYRWPKLNPKNIKIEFTYSDS